MLRRSLQLLTAATLLLLAVVVVWGALGWSSAADTLAEAERLAASGQHAAAVAKLDLAERGYDVQHDAALRDRLWRLRLAAQNELQNPRGALNDIDNLLGGSAADDLELQLERIRLSIEVGEHRRALQLARAFVDAHEDHPRGLELAGAATAAAYADTEATLARQIARDVGTGAADRAAAAFATWLARPDGDPELDLALDELAAVYAADTRLAARWPSLRRDLRGLREDVQTALAFYRRSLEAGGTPSTAALAWAAAMAACGRVDDAQFTCEIDRRRPHHEGQAATALVAALALLQRGDDAAVVALVDRVLPANRLQARLDAGTVGAAAADLLLTRALAAWRLDEDATLLRTLGNLGALRRAGVDCPLQLHTAVGMQHSRNARKGDAAAEYERAESNLVYVTRLLQDAPPRPGWPDLLELVMPLRVAALQGSNRPEALQLGVFADWQLARPGALAPRLAFARYLIDAGKLAAAQSVLAEATALQPAAPEVFALRLDLARAEGRETGVDGEALLAQCLRAARPVPQVQNPVQLVLCAETALQQRRSGIAAASAQAAAEALPQWRLPRLLAIEAALLAGRAGTAAQQSRRLLELFPADAVTADLALRAHRAAGRTDRELLATVLCNCAPSPAVRGEALQVALADDARTAIVFAGGVKGEANAPPELRLLAARAHAAAGAPGPARELLESVIGEIDALPAAARGELTTALCDWVVAVSDKRDDAGLRPQITRLLARTNLRDPDAAPHLVRTAGAIAREHPESAYELLVHALAIGAPDSRHGGAFALAGRLALRLQQPRLAEEHWLAALAVDDGRAVAEDLTRLFLAEGRVERALQVYTLVDAPQDAALAARLGQLERAALLGFATLTPDPMGLLAQAAAAACGLPSRCDWQPADVPTTERRLELLSLLRDRDLAADALALARRLAETTPDSTTSLLLVARAAALAGEVDEAAALHRAVLERAPGPMLWREVALAANEPGYVAGDAIEQALGSAVLGLDFGGSTLGMMHALRRMVDNLDRAGLAELARDTRRQLWMLAPEATITTAADVDGVAALTDPYEAWYLLDRALPSLDDDVRPTARERLAERAAALVEARGTAVPEVYERALQHLARDGAHGCLVHFVLDHGATFPTQAPDATAARQLLLDQIGLAATGRDPGSWLLRSVERLVALQGATTTRTDVDAALRRHPTCLPLWHAFAAVRTRLREASAAVQDLRCVLAHADSADAVLAFVELAAATGTLQPADRERLNALPPAAVQTPAGRLARGLSLLRLGQPDQALPLLAAAPPRDDGLHLFALALAHLQSRQPDGGALARAVLERLAADYPSSSLARNAGSFARQLAPR